MGTDHSTGRTEMCLSLWDAPPVQLLLGILSIATPGAEVPVLLDSSWPVAAVPVAAAPKGRWGFVLGLAQRSPND